MTERWEQRLRELRVESPPDMWRRVRETPRDARRLGETPRRQRTAAALVALAVFAAAGVFVWHAFSPSRGIGPGTEPTEATESVHGVTLTYPSTWTLVDLWPLARSIASWPEPVGSSIRVPEGTPERGGLPVLQLSMEDLGLRSVCGAELTGQQAVLYVALNGGPYGVNPDGSPIWSHRLSRSEGPCGSGWYAYKASNEPQPDGTSLSTPYLVFAGFGPEVSQTDRDALFRAFDSLRLEPFDSLRPPVKASPSYVVPGSPSPSVADSSNAIVAMASGRGIPALDGAEIVRIDPVSGGLTQLTHAGDEGRSAMSPAWSPDGERIAFVMGDMHQPAALAGTYDLYIMGADGSGVQRVTQGMNAQLLTWSPDGEHIAFVRDQGAAISVVDLATGSVKDVYVPNAHQIVQVPSWSPDGSRIAFQMGPESVDIYTVDLSTGDLVRLTDDGDSGYPAWSPDGSRIVFRRGDNIWVMSADGTGATRITSCTLPCVDSFSPVWSPDGSTLTFVRQGDGGASLQLFEIGIDGSNLHQLTSGQTMYSNPSWRPGSHG